MCVSSGRITDIDDIFFLASAEIIYLCTLNVSVYFVNGCRDDLNMGSMFGNISSYYILCDFINSDDDIVVWYGMYFS